jgi:hypothetical protein
MYQKEITVYDDYAIVKVDVRIADATDREFYFTYNRNIQVHGFSPPYGYADVARTLVVKGEHFHPHLDIT